VNRSPSNSFNRPGILAEIPGDLFGNIEMDLHCPAFFLIIAHTDKHDLSLDWPDRIPLSQRLRRMQYQNMKTTALNATA